MSIPRRKLSSRKGSALDNLEELIDAGNKTKKNVEIREVINGNFVVYGTINVDFFYNVKAFPKGGQTIQSWGMYKAFGGKGANQSIALAKLGAKVKLLSKTGKDNNGEEALLNLENFGVDCDNVIKSLQPTGHAIIMLEDTKERENLIVVNGGANNDYPEPFAIPKAWYPTLDDSDYLLMQNEVNYGFNKAMSIYCYNKGMKVFADFWDPTIFNDANFQEAVYLFCPNKIEFSEMVGVDPTSWNIGSVTHEEFKKYEPTIGENSKFVVKMGTEGCIYYDKNRLVKAKACTTLNPAILEDHKVVDTVGAGDAFMSGFARTFTSIKFEGDDEQAVLELIEECLHFSNVCGFITVCRNGAQSSPNFSEVQTFMKKYDLCAPEEISLCYK